MSLVWEHYPTGGGELLTALAYADHAHDDGTGIRPSVAYMARKTRQSERTIQMHLASMRSAGWLLTVRYATGGVFPGPERIGRATEYRINPTWIASPAEFAPLSASIERVQSTAEKGAIDSARGRKAIAPQPPRTISEPTTTLSAGNEVAVVVGLDDLIWPSALTGAAQIPAAKALQDCPHADRQNVLDEIAGLAGRGAVRSPIGLLRKLVKSAKQGLFSPSAALEHQRKRHAEAIAIQKKIEEKHECEQHSTPQAREAGCKRITSILQQYPGLRGSAR